MNEIEISIPDVFDHLGKIKLTKDRQDVGYANLIRKENTAVLCDIYIYDNSRPLIKYIPWVRVGINFRNRGYGSYLLKNVIEYCKYHDIKEITGKASGDLDLLFPWYTKHGFTFNENKEIHLILK